MRKSRLIPLLCILCAQFVATSPIWSEPAIQILKLDPSPVEVASPLFVVYRIGNTGTAQSNFQLQLVIDSPLPYQYQTIPAGQTMVLSWGTTVATPGNRTVTLHIWEQIGTRTIQSCPDCPKTIPIWGDLHTVSQPLTVFSASNPPLRPQVLNIGPQGQDGAFSSDTSESGVVNKVAGDSSILYAVSTHAGVWRRKAGSGWAQLPNAPPRAVSIAVDPNNDSHVIVGERSDDKPLTTTDPGTLLSSRSGAWESTDGGDSWVKIYDPGLDPGYPTGGIGSVRDVAFAPQGNLILIATAHGIGVRVANGTAIGSTITVFPTAARFDVQELAVSASTAWGWTSDHQLLMLNMPAANWANPLAPLPWVSIQMPPTVTLSMADIGDKRTVTDVLTDCGVGCATLTNRHSPGGLAGVDDRAVLVFTPFVSPNHPLATEDSACKKKPVTAQVCDIFENRIGVLLFDPLTMAWTGQLTKDRDGRGLGGKAFAVAETLNCPALPDELSERRRFYVSSGQGLQEALSVNADGRFDWDNPVGGSEFQAVPAQHWGGPYGGHATKIHVDFWDFHLDPHVCPPGQFTAWLANDGGVYQADVSTSGGFGERPNPKFVGTLSGLSWQLHDAGLSTHNVNALVAAKRASDTATHLFYVTGDNDGFWGVNSGSLPGLKPGQWHHGGSAGDAISGLSDGSTMTAVGMRDYWAGGTCGDSHCAYTVDLQSGNAHGFNVGGRTVELVSSTIFTFIQSTHDEVASGSVKDLDASILVNLPIQQPNGKPIPGTYGQKVKAARAVVLRNKSFQKDPDGVSSHFSNWIIARDNLPTDTERFWVSNGHNSPSYFFFTPSSSTCPGGLVGDFSNNTWPCLIQNLALPSGSGAISGPVFVSPFQPTTIFAIQLGSKPMITYTTDGKTFCPAPNLTMLVTGSTEIPLTADSQGQFDPSSRFAEAGEAYHGSVLPMLSQVAFDRSDATGVLVITPLTGVYFGRLGIEAGRCVEPTWLSLQGLNDNWGYPSTGVLLDGTGFIGTEGRGIFEISSPSSGLPASYFEVDRNFRQRTVTATLKSSNGTPIPWALYALVIRGRDGRVVPVLGKRTDAGGQINISAAITKPGFLACELTFFGDGQNAPTELRFNCSTP